MESQHHASHLEKRTVSRLDSARKYHVPCPEMSPLEPSQLPQHSEQGSCFCPRFALGKPIPEEIGRHGLGTIMLDASIILITALANGSENRNMRTNDQMITSEAPWGRYRPTPLRTRVTGMMINSLHMGMLD